jgi:hypothetical protein
MSETVQNDWRLTALQMMLDLPLVDAERAVLTALVDSHKAGSYWDTLYRLEAAWEQAGSDLSILIQNICAKAREAGLDKTFEDLKRNV